MLKFSKEDFMKLDKKRLVEMLLDLQEKQDEMIAYPQPYTPFNPGDYRGEPPCWSPDGHCSNPFHDCIDCPGKQTRPGTTTWTTHTTSNLQPNNFKNPLND